MADLKNTFVREIELFNTSLKIHQAVEGDVGCVVWDAAIVLVKYLEKTRKEDFKNKTVIELGAGTGLVSLSCSLAGANVCSTDLKELLPLIELNKTTNEMHLKGKVDIRELKWGEKTYPCVPSVDYLIMSDVIYYNESLEPLTKTICDLADKHTEVIMSYEQRFDSNKPFLEKHFFELIGEQFLWTKVPFEEMDPVFRSNDIHIVTMRKKNC